MSSAPKRPFDVAYLRAYSEQHVAYEVKMLQGLAATLTDQSSTMPSTPGALVANASVESFAMHLRNVTDFLYDETPYPTDIVATDYCVSGAWPAVRPAKSPALARAYIRANKEVGHLTTSRQDGAPSGKSWDFQALATELLDTMRLLPSAAEPLRLSPAIAKLLA